MTMNIPAEMLAAIDATADELVSSRSVAVRYLFRHEWSKSTSPCIKVNQSDITVNHSAHPSPGEDTRAPVTLARKKEREREGERGELADYWRSTDPFRLLPDPMRTLAQMRTAFPGVDLLAQSARIAMWWDEHPPPRPGKPRRDGERWKQEGISAGIRGWLGRAGKGNPRGTGSRGGAGPQASLDLDPNIWLEGCDNA